MSGTVRTRAGKKDGPARRAITRLFWGRFPFKVETTYPAAGFHPLRLHPPHMLTHEAMRREHGRYNRAVGAFRRACLRYVPDSASDWKLYELERSFHFYFMRRADMERFVAGNAARVRVLHEPLADSDVAVLSGARDTMIRPTLFFDEYKYCVIFKESTPGDELDGWVNEMFSDSSAMGYSNIGVRRLYLNQESDVLMTRLAFNRHISRVQTVLLRSEINDACESGQAVG